MTGVTFELVTLLNSTKSDALANIPILFELELEPSKRISLQKLGEHVGHGITRRCFLIGIFL